MHHARRLRLMITALAAFLAAVATINFGVNPYGAWPVAIIDRVFLNITPPAERIATPYRVRHERPETLLAGTSRVLEGMKIEQGAYDGALNAALAGATIDETAGVLRLAMENPDLRRVVWAVDFPTFSVQYAGFRDDQTRQRLAGSSLILLRETLLSLEALTASSRLLLRALGGQARLPWSRRVPVPWPEETIRSALRQLPRNDLRGRERELDAHLRSWLDVYRAYQWSDRQMHLYAELVAQLRSRGVDVIAFLPPLSAYELETIRQSGQWEVFRRWKRELARVGPYWDFSGYNAIAARDELFTGHVICHFHPAVGHTVLRSLLGRGCEGCGELAQAILGAGVFVDATTVETHLRQQDSARHQYAATRSPQSAAVERAGRPEEAVQGEKEIASNRRFRLIRR
jgi:hypothetical protein